MTKYYLKYSRLIMLFAFLHLAASVIFHILHVSDTIILTLLTMAMVLIISVKERLSVEFTSINVIFVNIAGYLLGIALASILGLFLESDILIHGASTFLTTCLVGITIVWFTRIFNSPNTEERTPISEDQLMWMGLAVGIIFILRILVNALTNSKMFLGGGILSIVSGFVSNSVIMLTLICVTIIAIQYFHTIHGRMKVLGSLAVTAVFIVTLSGISALMVAYGLPFRIDLTVTFREFLELFIVALICETTIFSIIYMSDYAVTARRAAEAAKMKANTAQAQYINLKQLVNPHFLFNSLNVLDYLVAEGNTSQSREYIRKLSGMYRYMLNNENRPVVTLSEELEYTGMYVDLMKVRFPEGFLIETDIPDEDLDRLTVTYSVQMLIENALKHNTVSADNPLTVRISSDGRSVCVSNNLIPKIETSQSTGIGLKYISRNYIDRTGKDISVERTATDYSVTMPLL